MSRKKPTRTRENKPSVSKKPKAIEAYESDQTVKWCFSLFDKDKCWHDGQYSEETFREVAYLLKNYSTMTWGMIERDRKRDHAIKISKLGKDAKKRLEELRLDDFGPLWRFRFTGLKRIWGIRMGRFFQVLWWDPQHKVYPTER
jgi:hypothetical protein